MTEAAKAKTPAYVPYKSFKNYVRGLATDDDLPSHIDPSVLKTMSGSTQNQFMTSLRFFGLLNSDDSPTEGLRLLALSDETTWKQLMVDLIRKFYGPQIPVLGSGTVEKLKESFGEDLKDTAMIVPAMRFLIAAAQDCAIKVSTHVAKGVPSIPRKRPSIKEQRASINAEPDHNDEQEKPPAKPADTIHSALLAKFPDFNPQWDADQQKSWFAAYEKLLAMNTKASA